MAAFSATLSPSHAAVDLGFNDYGHVSCKQKYKISRRESLAAPGQHRTTFSILRRPKTLSATRPLVQSSCTQNDDSVVLRERSGDNSSKDATSQRNPLSSELTSTIELGFMLKNKGKLQLLNKLSVANQYIRQLQHDLRDKEEALVKTRSELSAMQMELQVLVRILHEIGRQGIKPGTQKINGRYIHSHLASRLEEMQRIVQERIKDADQVRVRRIDLVFYGMAEDVQVMGSFDGWTRGEQMSPENTGTFTKFTTSIKLRPGQYEIKFLVDGEWQLSPELPTVGEGLTMNNMIIVDGY
ncbi:protein PTST, chloroplastic [Physcomitrium patens]|uniref:AMP-activated protein kinase glycogen-binding domain-containing protein n=1 Tax=Physcomitrium patens TaxID=3218 RepID=A0A2K1JHA8_PHYPA|nr:protein PTST, chloroplastic-like [Physcomitrium patens]PNR40932.1 hypothetical protein PHYPA_018335 [Physcomitrium patens]|eukprot:XP_024394946.1 protein PTST, chloroplastic-like [Physcomitrella patens]